MMPDRSRYSNNPTITIEYDCRGARKRKEFPCPYEARRFYIARHKSGHNPTIISNHQTEK